MTIPTNAERAEARLTQHDIEHFRRIELTMRARPYAVSATEAADVIASLLFHLARLAPVAKQGEA